MHKVYKKADFQEQLKLEFPSYPEHKCYVRDADSEKAETCLPASAANYKRMQSNLTYNNLLYFFKKIYSSNIKQNTQFIYKHTLSSCHVTFDFRCYKYKSDRLRTNDSQRFM